jgi:hypothetical protein
VATSASASIRSRRRRQPTTHRQKARIRRDRACPANPLSFHLGTNTKHRSDRTRAHTRSRPPHSPQQTTKRVLRIFFAPPPRDSILLPPRTQSLARQSWPASSPTMAESSSTPGALGGGKVPERARARASLFSRRARRRRRRFFAHPVPASSFPPHPPPPNPNHPSSRRTSRTTSSGRCRSRRSSSPASPSFRRST